MILVATVGGSCQPIVTAIRDYEPEYVGFLVSSGPRGSHTAVDGNGTPCRQYNGDNQPSIVAQTGLSADQYEKISVDEPDSLHLCYATARAALSRLNAQFPNADQVVDYTGGTKSMSVGLAIAAMEADWRLSLVKGARRDLVRVTDGTESAGLVNSWEVRARQQMEEARRLFNQFDYAAADDLLRSILQSNPLSVPLQETLRRWRSYCRGFDAWDRFDHERAYLVLETFAGNLTPNWLFLKRMLDKMHDRSGYEFVFDLLRNAERRAGKGRYDDAVARLYRALEMFAQMRMAQRTPALNSSDLDASLLPEALREQYVSLARDDKIQLGLRQDYELLGQLGDPVGEVYSRYSQKVLTALTKRNHSILAHGDTPLTRSDYETMLAVVQQVILESCDTLKVTSMAPQFPQLVEDDLQQR